MYLVISISDILSSRMKTGLDFDSDVHCMCHEAAWNKRDVFFFHIMEYLILWSNIAETRIYEKLLWTKFLK